jgi:hypothetical protein
MILFSSLLVFNEMAIITCLKVIDLTQQSTFITVFFFFDKYQHLSLLKAEAACIYIYVNLLNSALQ